MARRQPEGLLWPDLLESVASGHQRLVLEASSGRRAVLLSESELVVLEQAARTVNPRTLLTAREQEVLRLVADGLTGTAVAEQLGLATNTVAQHLTAVRRKLGVHNSADAIAAARATGQLADVQDDPPEQLQS